MLVSNFRCSGDGKEDDEDSEKDVEEVSVAETWDTDVGSMDLIADSDTGSNPGSTRGSNPEITPDGNDSASVTKSLENSSLCSRDDNKNRNNGNMGDEKSDISINMTDESEGDIEEKRKQLLDYCEMDTLAMVKILDKLLEI